MLSTHLLLPTRSSYAADDRSPTVSNSLLAAELMSTVLDDFGLLVSNLRFARTFKRKCVTHADIPSPGYLRTSL